VDSVWIGQRLDGDERHLRAEFRDRPRILAEVPDFKEEFLGLAPNSSGAKGLIERKNLLEAQIDDVRESGSDVAAALRAPQSQRSLPIGRS